MSVQALVSPHVKTRARIWPAPHFHIHFVGCQGVSTFLNVSHDTSSNLGIRHCVLTGG